MGMQAKPAVFFDRDGTLNVEKNYLYRPEDFEWISGAQEAVHLLNEAGFLVFVITNQAGVARGFYSEQDVNRLHDFMADQLEQKKAHMDAFFYCPHHPEGTIPEYTKLCDCRKPASGMIRQALMRFDIDLNTSFVVGDYKSDIELANREAIRSVLVKTGHGQKTLDAMSTGSTACKPDHIAEEVTEAVRWILWQHRERK
ncbi:HAD family hydrolase [bacterium]|nr:HAD family hydrolase [bacterium]NUN46216.1 HAD family hydrolase [bacterium]